jgi:hypothetical protein
MNAEFKWTDNLVAEFLQTQLHIKDTKCFDFIEKFIESKKPKPLFVTEDGKDVFDQDTVWQVCILSDSWSCSCTKARIEITPIPSYFKYFSLEEKARDYMLYNRPLLSLNEIESIGQIQDPDQNIYFKRLIKAAKDKLK